MNQKLGRHCYFMGQSNPFMDGKYIKVPLTRSQLFNLMGTSGGAPKVMIRKNQLLRLKFTYIQA